MAVGEERKNNLANSSPSPPNPSHLEYCPTPPQKLDGWTLWVLVIKVPDKDEEAHNLVKAKMAMVHPIPHPEYWTRIWSCLVGELGL